MAASSPAAEIAAPQEGQPYGEVAYRVMRPFVGDAFDEATFRRLIGEAYASFETTRRWRHSSRWATAGLHLLELFHGPTLAFKDLALQLLGRMFDQVLARRGASASPSSAPPRATPVRPRSKPLRGRKADRHLHAASRGPRLGGAAPPDDHGAAPNVHNIAIDGTFDDCQDLVKAMFADAPSATRMRCRR